jgi:hypothetical protein
MVQFSTMYSTDVEVTVRRDGHFLYTKYIPNDMTVRQLVMYLAKGDTKFFLTTSYTQDVTFMQPVFLDKTMGSYKVDEAYVECTTCQEYHQCQLNNLNMCIVNEEKGIPVVSLLDVVNQTENQTENQPENQTSDSEDSEDSATATTEAYESEDSMPDLVSMSSRLENEVGE